MKKKNKSSVPFPVESMLNTVREHRVMLDTDLARIYGVESRRLNEQVKRNAGRFPDDLCFGLSRRNERSFAL